MSSDTTYESVMRSRWGSRNFQHTCRECGRVFDLLDEDDAMEFEYGHDCEREE